MVEKHIFGKTADPQSVILSKNELHYKRLNWFVYILGAPPSKQTSKKN